MAGTLTRRVHIVDDDDAVRDSMRALLESMDIEVRDYSSALGFLVQFCAKPEGLLLDLRMPGMLGPTLLELLSRRKSALPIIAITGLSDPVLKDRVLQAGAFALLDSPSTRAC